MEWHCLLWFNFASNGFSHFGIIYNNLNYSTTDSQTILSLNTWQHLAFTLNGNNSVIYLNGQIIAESSSMLKPKAIVRANCYFGRSNWNDAMANASFDEIKFFNRALSKQEIFEEYSNSYPILKRL